MVQLQASVNGDLLQMEQARSLQRTAVGATPPAAPAEFKAKKKEEVDLGLWLAFQGSTEGRKKQAAATQASKALADSVGGHRAESSQKISTVFHRLSRQVMPRPGMWLLRSPVPRDSLQGKPGAFLPS